MTLKKRIDAFVKLGEFLRQFNTLKIEKNEGVLYNATFFDALQMQINRAQEFNAWFTKENVIYALEYWGNLLNQKKLFNWTNTYNLDPKNSKKVSIILAGNIPLVGFHDFLSVLISGHSVLIKQSSSDQYFLPILAQYLEKIEPDFKDRIHFTKGILKDFDAVIATGSNNTARYFDYYFKKHPNIIRHNRNSIAVLNGKESQKDLENLGEDIFRYFGLGCRSISKIFVPKNYDFDLFFKAIYKYKDLINYIKYENNYTYNKAVYLMSQFKLLENGFLLLKEDKSYASPIASLFYEFYENVDDLKKKLDIDKEQIQVIVSNENIKKALQFGVTQQPELTDYADGVDTLAFLSKLD